MTQTDAVGAQGKERKSRMSMEPRHVVESLRNKRSASTKNAHTRKLYISLRPVLIRSMAWQLHSIENRHGIPRGHKKRLQLMENGVRENGWETTGEVQTKAWWCDGGSQEAEEDIKSSTSAKEKRKTLGEEAGEYRMQKQLTHTSDNHWNPQSLWE